MAAQSMELAAVDVYATPGGDLGTTVYVSLWSIYSIYLGRFPQFGGVADNTKETNKNNGGFTPFFQQ